MTPVVFPTGCSTCLMLIGHKLGHLFLTWNLFLFTWTKHFHKFVLNLCMYNHSLQSHVKCHYVKWIETFKLSFGTYWMDPCWNVSVIECYGQYISQDSFLFQKTGLTIFKLMTNKKWKRKCLNCLLTVKMFIHRI